MSFLLAKIVETRDKKTYPPLSPASPINVVISSWSADLAMRANIDRGLGAQRDLAGIVDTTKTSGIHIPDCILSYESICTSLCWLMYKECTISVALRSDST